MYNSPAPLSKLPLEVTVEPQTSGGVVDKPAPCSMLWGLVQSLVQGLTIDLKVFSKEASNDVKRGYNGYSGKIDYITPDYIGAVGDVLTKINQKLSQANSATMTLLLFVVGLFIWLAVVYFTIIRLKQKWKNTTTDLELNVATVEEQVGGMAQERERNEMLKRTKDLINSLGFNKTTNVPVVRHDGGENLDIVGERSFREI